MLGPADGPVSASYDAAANYLPALTVALGNAPMAAFKRALGRRVVI